MSAIPVNWQGMRMLLKAGSLGFLAACMSAAQYQPPPSGASVAFVQRIEPRRSSSQVTPTVRINRRDEAGNFVFVGQLSGDMLASPPVLTLGVEQIIEANLMYDIGITHLR
jgi:hypothetical protein